MGANQSSKSSHQQPAVSSRKLFGSSLRKGMGNVLSHSGSYGNSGKQSKQQNEPSKGKQISLDNSSQRPSIDEQQLQLSGSLSGSQYYVSGANRSKSFTAANNYVTMQQQQQQRPAQLSPIGHQNNNNSSNNNNNYYYTNNISQSKQSNSKSQLEQANGNNGSNLSGANCCTKAMEMNSVRGDGSFDVMLEQQQQQQANRSLQQHQQHQQHHHHQQPQIQNHQQLQLQQQPMHFSRALNAKTSNVLNNSQMVAMPNNQPAKSRTSLATNNNNNSNHNHNNSNSFSQSPYRCNINQSSYSAMLGSPAIDYDSENQQQYYLGNLIDANEQQRLRYKYPQQALQHQHQYLANEAANNYQRQQLADFHQFRGDYQRSQSFGSSNYLETKRRQNPLAALFQPNQISAGAGNSGNQQLRKHHHQSQTINLARRSKQNNGRQSSGGSLKRIKSTPLSAQQASYEAMRTIDMYLIRQIARSCMNFEMEQKIELEIRLRELASQSMLEAQTEIDVLEVEKSLLTSDQRMNCYASQLEQQRKQLSNPSLSTADSGRGSGAATCASSHARARELLHRSDVVGASSPSFSSSSQSPSKLSPVSGESANSPPSFASSGRHSRTHSTNTLSAKQRAKNKKREQLMQTITSLSNINCNMVVESRASLSISEIRIPLMWRDVDHFKNRGDYKRFAVFCLLKVDSQIYDTQLISDVDRQVTDVTFDDLIVFNDVDHNFELTLEVYSCVYLEQFSLSSTPRKLKEKLSSSVSRAMGRRLATQTASSNYTKELQAYDRSYRFALIASANLKLEDASDSVRTYDLALVSPKAHHRHHQTTSQSSNNSSVLNQGSPRWSIGSNKDSDKNTLPLFGHFCCKILLRPDVFDKSLKSGYLRVATISIPQLVSPLSVGATNESSSSANSSTTGQLAPSSDDHHSKLSRLALAASSKMATLSMSSSSLHWALLRNFNLHLWQLDEPALEKAIARGESPPQLIADNLRRPRYSLNINKYTRLLRVSNSSLTLETERGCFVFGAAHGSRESLNQSDEIGNWLRAIEQLIYDSHIWGSVLNHYPAHTSRQSADGRVQTAAPVTAATTMTSATSSSSSSSYSTTLPTRRRGSSSSRYII